MRSDVVALYVDPKGPYPKLVQEWYDEERDATTYRGPLPVVAHPPCGPYCKLRKFNKYQRPQHAIHAVEMVRGNGGVLEHPAGSLLWPVAGLPRPGGARDGFGGYTIEVEQVRWGHRAVKRTWLYIVRCGTVPPIPPMRAHTHTCGMNRAPGTRPLGSVERRMTPVAFAEWLLELASGASKNILERFLTV